MIVCTPAARRQVAACSRPELVPPVAPSDDYVTLPYVTGEARIQVLERVPRHISRIADRVGVFAGKNHVGVDVVAVNPGAAGDWKLVTGYWKLEAGNWGVSAATRGVRN